MSHAIIVVQGCIIWAFGKNDKGQLCLEEKPYNTRIPSECDFYAVSQQSVKGVDCGDNFSIILAEDGFCWAAGANNHVWCSIHGTNCITIGTIGVGWYQGSFKDGKDKNPKKYYEYCLRCQSHHFCIKYVFGTVWWHFFRQGSIVGHGSKRGGPIRFGSLFGSQCTHSNWIWFAQHIYATFRHCWTRSMWQMYVYCCSVLQLY